MFCLSVSVFGEPLRARSRPYRAHRVDASFRVRAAFLHLHTTFISASRIRASLQLRRLLYSALAALFVGFSSPSSPLARRIDRLPHRASALLPVELTLSPGSSPPPPHSSSVLSFLVHNASTPLQHRASSHSHAHASIAQPLGAAQRKRTAASLLAPPSVRSIYVLRSEPLTSARLPTGSPTGDPFPPRSPPRGHRRGQLQALSRWVW